ncbi:alpha/beta fold hydrolase [Halovenus sp. WSH3]|uniref:Palmitoyl-protein thioesterase ABHD10, mitochondrial n=1 Tax=Halovenus carboxidivorans TaxID=2692199 RepID=A0A6B0T7H6_9EURY|nr:alpha/beta hydrolase [Halovenus carboxidivorans]MXR51543.1 alpha/beta fold hydrolase [Halovenus carboxidivorans]
MPTRHEIPIDGERIVAVHHEADSDRFLVCCHGFLSDKTGSYESRCVRAVEEGYNGVRFDFRGCGESSRSFGGQNLSTRIADLRAVLSYFDPAETVLFGSSFGGQVALHVGATASVEAIAVRAPVTTTETFERYRPPSEGSGLIVGIERSFFDDLESYPFESAAADISVPVALFHGRDDDSVAIEDSIDAAGLLSVDTLLDCYAGEGHRFSRAAEARMRDRLFAWLATLDR